MSYAAGRVINDADSHIMESLDWLASYADPKLRDRLGGMRLEAGGSGAAKAIAKALGAQPYFAGERFTLADALIAPQVDFFQQCPEWEALAGPHANLRAWMDRVAARPSFAATTWERLDSLAKAA